MPFTAHTLNVIQEMLKEIGVENLEDLFSSIPPELRLKGELKLPSGLSERDARFKVSRTLSRNIPLLSYRGTFLGGGIYFHYVPSAVDHLSSLPGFVTPYTPYQPEASQGILTASFEFQTMVCELTEMEVANASLYDGSTASAEAVLMGLRIGRGERVFLSKGMHPYYREVIRTYLLKKDVEILELKLSEEGRTIPPQEGFKKGDVILIQSPNFYGIVEDLPAWGKLASEAGAIAVHTFTEALSLAILKTPGESGFHISAGEGASFGLYPSLGGPSLGLFATKMSFLRQVPGRIAGETYDLEGNRGFVFTLSTREQHIRRAKATSNVCTNVQLNALRAVIYLSLMGTALPELALDNASRAHALFKLLTGSSSIKPAFSGEFFNEFTVELPKDAREVVREMKERGFLAGVPASLLDPGAKPSWLIISVTEMNDDASIREFADNLKEVCS